MSEETQQPTSENTGMNFAAALAYMKRGHAVKMPEWGGYWTWSDSANSILIHTRGGVVMDLRQSNDLDYTFSFILRNEWLLVHDVTQTEHHESAQMRGPNGQCLQPVDIHVAGPSPCGKSALTALIEKAIKERYPNVEVVAKELDAERRMGDPDNPEEWEQPDPDKHYIRITEEARSTSRSFDR